MSQGLNPERASDAPLARHLREVQEAERASFHMPGHKGARGAPPQGRALLGDRAYDADVSELGGFDYLHHPQSAILESERRAAALLGAARTWFLVNGATVGNLAAICATVGDGETVLIARGSHRSAYAGLALSGARPLYLPPVASTALDGLFGIDPADVARALREHPEIRAVHVTSPSYYGFCVALQEIRELTSAAGVPLIVDEAHGTHFALHPGLPTSALRIGADLVVQSPHKTLSSFTQSSLLHHQGDLVDADRVDGLLQMLQSSSPSALLLVSLDVAIDEMARSGEEAWGHALELADHIRAEAKRLFPLAIYEAAPEGLAGVVDGDPTKLVVDVGQLAWTAPNAASFLAARHGIRPEFTDLRRMVFSITPSDSHEQAALLLEALADLTTNAGPVESSAALVSLWPAEVPEMAVDPRAGSMPPSQPTTSLTLGDAVGRVAGEMIVPYPPGIPLLVPGEVVSESIVATIEQLREAGCRIVGMADTSGSQIRCLSQAL